MLALYQEGVSGPANSANIDTHITLLSPTTNFGTIVTQTVGVTNGATKIYRAFHEFVLSDIPGGSEVLACTLQVVASNVVSPTNGHLYKVCALHWLDGDGLGEAQATWNIWKTANNWGTAGGSSTTACASGGDITTMNGVAYVAPGGSGTYTFPDMTALCQDAVDVESGHLRLRIAQDAEGTVSNQFDYKSSDTTTAASNRPRLSVTYR